MGTANTMNSLAEGLGMSLPGSAAIPAPLSERSEIAFLTGKRIVGMVEEDLTPFGFITTGLENESFTDSTGERWQVVE